MLMIVSRTERLETIPEKDLIAFNKNGECAAYCILFLKLNSMVILEFDSEMSKILINFCYWKIKY